MKPNEFTIMTRVALPRGSLVVISSQGGGTKDTWVLRDGPNEPVLHQSQNQSQRHSPAGDYESGFAPGS
jgi:uncharacterized circularly permuted ATP-grasp superfamily protein